jgi:hypothetical protein
MRVTMFIAALLLAALSLEAQVFPDPLCKNLPEVSPEVKAWVARVAPELAQVSVRELPEKTALDVFGRAAAAGWGSVDVLTQRVFREPCTFYFSREALRAVDAAFVLDLLTVIRGQDKKGQDFEMTALLAGRGKLVVFYDRDGIVYWNERLARDFKLASRVEFDTPADGVLENVQGLCANVRLLGCVRVRSLVKVGETLEVHAGTFTSETPLKPIQARKGRSSHAPGDARRSGSEAGDFIVSPKTLSRPFWRYWMIGRSMRMLPLVSSTSARSTGTSSCARAGHRAVDAPALASFVADPAAMAS